MFSEVTNLTYKIHVQSLNGHSNELYFDTQIHQNALLRIHLCVENIMNIFVFHKCGEFLEQLSYSQLLEKECVAWK